MPYLSKTNKPSRFTNKQLNSYKEAKKEGLSGNPYYNEKVLGITNSLYHWMNTAVVSSYGTLVSLNDVKLQVLNKWLTNGGQIYDDNDYLLTYYNKRIRYE